VLRARLVTALIAIPALVIIILFLPSTWPVAVLVTTVSVIGVAEYASMAFPSQRGERILTLVLGTVLLLAAAAQSHVPYLLSAALALTVTAGLVWTLLARPDFEKGLSDLGLALVGITYIGLLMPHFIWLHEILPHGPQWVIFVLVIGMAGDSGGYFVGHAIGRHKLMPRVSPGKTIEGALGIVAASLLGGAVSKLVLLPERSWSEMLVLSALMAVLGQLGDLSESIMKRTFAVKESGWLFPGHGGVLDRIDSLLFPVAFLYYHILLSR
jgi:phosphatidate cytidylyltransferase